MFTKEIKEYDTLLHEYKIKVIELLSPNDLKKYHEILFSSHSCGIEGNSFTVDETLLLKEKGLGMIPEGKSLLESFEMIDHLNAYEFLLSNVDKPLTEDLLKETHCRLMANTLAYKTVHDETPAIPGEYTTYDMVAGDTVFGNHKELIKQMLRLLDSTRRMLDEGMLHPVVIAARFHGFFEYLHPFRDGNGRLGRLFSNFILLQKKHFPLIIERKDRETYIDCLRQIKKEQTDEYLVFFFFRISINRMKQEITDKEKLTERFGQGDFFLSF
ncbi:MAG: Fic family protein [Tannerellaceae bacterium]|jgi:Fic family protein|nr:Fic family protein [Tannerellaceae bacterium]